MFCFLVSLTVVCSSCFTQMINTIINEYKALLTFSRYFSANFSELSGDISPITCVSDPGVF